MAVHLINAPPLGARNLRGLQLPPAEVSSPHTYLPLIIKKRMFPEPKTKAVTAESVGAAGPALRQEAGTGRIWAQVRAKHRW